MRKEERIYLFDEINTLFGTGASFFQYPFRVIYQRVPYTGVPIRILISIPKKHFKRAYARNRLKRLTREAFRLNKYKYVDAHTSWGEDSTAETLLIGFIYSSKTLHSFDTIHRSVLSIQKEIQERLYSKSSDHQDEA